jgi:predicted HicB family RNase H-like nuclease
MDQNHINQEDQKRISILVTKEIHRRIKIQALNADQSMKDYIISLITDNTSIQELGQ